MMIMGEISFINILDQQLGIEKDSSLGVRNKHVTETHLQ